MKYLIAGLGNIGDKYADTRHNIGFIALDYMMQRHDMSFTKDKYALKTEIKYRGRKLIFIKPSLYMNFSGKSIAYWLQKMHIPKAHLIVIVDDIALPFGKLRIREKGTAGGHNGLANIELLTNGSDYPRLRVGIGNDFSKGQQTNYVLSPFLENEKKQLLTISHRIEEAILHFCVAGINSTMRTFNTDSSD